MIKDKISQLQNELSRLKENYKNLVKDIKVTFYDKKSYFDENSPRKPSGEIAMMQAALCLAQGKCPRHSFDLNVRQARSWEKGEDDVWLDYFTINQERFNHGNGIPATIIIRKKNLKLLRSICKDLWIKEVSASFRPKTILGFEEWIEATSTDKILELMEGNLNEHKGDRVYLVTDRNLYIKDIVIIFPNSVQFFGNI